MANTRTSGLIFPLQLTSGKHTVSSGVELIEASLKTILAWPLEHRMFLPEFGSRVEEILESPNDAILTTLIRRYVIDSISTWEQRIELLDISMERPSPTSLTINLIYKIRELNIENSFEYTYYVN